MRRTAKEFLNDFRQRLIENQPPIDFKNPQKGFPGWWEDDTVQEMMDAYASEVLKDFSQQFYADEETCKHNIDEYLRLTNLDSALKNCVDISKLK
jgi:hypothetical protein